MRDMTFAEYLDKVGRSTAWIKRENIDELAPTYEALAYETAREFRRYFHDGDKGTRAQNNMEVMCAALVERYGAFAQVHKMGAPDAALVVYGSHAAWYNGLKPVTVIPFDSVEAL